jgi:cell division protein ZapE
LLFEFRRTYSRLIEMKSHYYQALRIGIAGKLY